MLVPYQGASSSEALSLALDATTHLLLSRDHYWTRIAQRELTASRFLAVKRREAFARVALSQSTAKTPKRHRSGAIDRCDTSAPLY